MNEIVFSSAGLGVLLTAVCRKQKAFKFRAKGGSMSPFIRNNNLIIIKPYTKYPEVGDVAAYISVETKQMFVHRIIKQLKNGYYVFKGDSNKQSDDIVHIDAIYGYVESVIQKKIKIKYGSFLYNLYALLAKRNLTYSMIKYFRILKKQF